jgi:RHS repeat-associated protein
LLRRYVHGPGVDEPLVAYEGVTASNKSWLYKDHLGSIVGTADATGTSTAVYSYGPYGEPNTLTGQRFRYTGQQLIGELWLYYYKARFYSPALGRFLQIDPIGTVDDLNLYAYVGGNPANFGDPTGLTAKDTGLLNSTITTTAAAGSVVIAQNEVRDYTVYERTGPNGECYVGQCQTTRFTERQAEHDRATGRDNTYRTLDRIEGTRTDARVLEETRIRQGGGTDVLENKRYEMNDQKFRALGGSATKPVGGGGAGPIGGAGGAGGAGGGCSMTKGGISNCLINLN